MIIYLGADHRGFAMKEAIKKILKDQGYSDVVDMGSHEANPEDDYPDFAAPVARKVGEDPVSSRGIVICGSGAGVDIVANKFPGVRSVLALSGDQVFDARQHDDVNILSISANTFNEEQVMKMIQIFMATQASKEEKYVRRAQKIANIETELYR